tara:strand:+ start:8204 stop:8644 length:441 start_codon:yes stop_codon:yes gene_type:complete
MENNLNIEILLVEDSDQDAELAIRAFKKNNIANSIVRLRDGEAALDFIFARNQYSDRAITNQPKVVLLDLKMPKVNGIEVLREIRNNESTKNLPVVMLTSSNAEKDIVESYKLGVNSYIVKPVNFEGFSNAIRDIGMYWVVLNRKP